MAQRALALPVAQTAQHAHHVGFEVGVEVAGVHADQRAASQVDPIFAQQLGECRVGALDQAVLDEGNADTRQREHQVAVTAQRFELRLLRSDAGDV